MKSTYAIVAAVAALAFSSTAWAGAGEDLLAKEKCSKCHTATTTKKGPSFASVAAKYKADAGAAAKLADMLKTGGNDHDKVAASDADLKAAIAVVLASK
jgi:cytochrome c551/c552